MNIRTSLLLIAGLAAAFLFSCDSTSGVPGSCPHNLATSFDSTFDNGEIDALLEATGRFSVAATDIDTEVRTACNGISTDLGGAMGNDTETACMNAIEQIRRVKMANATVMLAIEYVPAVCSASIDAVVDCTAECDASFDATATPPTCEGGEISGSCSGSCMGSCTVEGSVVCDASCSGTCMGMCDAEVSGSCTGTCNGQCEGTCSAMAGDGSCMGTCMGTCRGECTGEIMGSCSGSCTGMCSGSCRADAMGMCMGSCSGGCSAEMTELRCEGGEWDVMADADCQAACESDASFELECTEPSLVVTFTGAVAMPADLLALIATLEEHLPNMLAAAAKAEIVIDATATFASSLSGAASAAADNSIEASMCVGAAITAQADALAKVQVSVDVSVMVSAEANASAGS
jgi:hypothetical protein